MVAFTAGAVLTAANLNTAFNTLTFRAVTGTSDTFLLADNGGAVSYSNASPITATVPPFSSVAYANGTVIQLLNLGAGVVTITAGVGVTLNGSIVTLAQNAGGTLIKTATNTWYFLPSASGGAGMDLMTPSGVVNGTLSGGEVSFSAAATLSVNGCFNSTYDSYRIVTQLSNSADAEMKIRMRAAGADATGANYDDQYFYAAGTGTGAIRTTSATSGGVGRASTDYFCTIDMHSPALAAITYYIANMYYGPGVTTVLDNGRHNVATAYDGFSFIPASGTMTGKLRVYGLRKS
jgi:hypothetical protein